jgi:DNA polymerase-3 subunit alpha
MDFVHLHNHTDYSILDGAITIDKLIDQAVKFNMPAVAITDHGNMFGAVEFYEKAAKKGIKPIIGEEFYVAPDSRFKREYVRGGDDDNAHHLLVLAKDLTGYKNLMKLSSIGYLEGFYYKPRIDMEVLEKYSEGLIAASGCIAGEIPRYILRGRLKEARELAGRCNELFGAGNFYLELQYHGIKEQEIANRELIKIASELNIPLIATNDSHYVDKSDAYSHEVLLCVQTGKTIKDEKRMRFSSDQFYFKSLDEMRRIFPDHPDALSNTRLISEMIDLKLDLGKAILPNFEVPDGFNLDSYLRHLVNEGAQKIYGHNIQKVVLDRIDYELSVITNMKFSGYFLIVWDFIKYARSVNIPVGPGRGSAVGSIVSYCLGITALDPLKYNLLFERFLNPDRNEMPDMDLDFCADRREEVIEYVRQKYGDDHVSQIITINKMKAKAVVKDVARALDIPFAEANDISKFIDGKTLKKSIDSSKELKKVLDSETGKELIDISLRLEGLARSAGKHAAGVVISRGPLTDYVPLYKDKDGNITSQYDKNTLEKAGLVKMDFLGLRNLSIIDKCIKLVKRTTGDVIDIDTIPLDDKDTYKLLQKVDTKGVFQLESSGMQKVLGRFGPTEFEDIIAIEALYRPGPIESGMLEDFIERKKKPALVKYLHPSLEAVLKETLGVVVYQEQVMFISQIIGGFTLPEADKLRKAMGKKDMAIIDNLEEKFLGGAEENKIDKKIAVELYDMIKKFGEYGFNKSHSAAYAMVTYQTAYLKTHHRLQYMASLLSAALDKQDDVVQYINDSREHGIKVLPPSINNSYYDFSIEANNLRFGFGAIKGLGEKAIENIIDSRERLGGFKTIKEFLENIDLTVVNKGVLEALIKSGSFDEIHKNRAQLLKSIDYIIDFARRCQKDIESGQGDLFSSDTAQSGGINQLDLPAEPEWDDNQKLNFEKEVLGIYVSSHPLAKFEKELNSFPSYTLSEISEANNSKEVSVVGIISNVITKPQKKGDLYADAWFEDLSGSAKILIFSKTLEKFNSLVYSGEPVMVTGRVEIEGGGSKKIITTSIKSLKDVRRKAVSAVHIKLDPLSIDDGVIVRMKEIIERHKGDCPVYFHVKDQDETKTIKVHTAFNIFPSEDFMNDIGQLVESDSVRFSFAQYN